MKKLFLFLGIGLLHLSAVAQKTDLSEYTGTYVFPEGSVVASVEVTLADTVLTMSSEAGSSIITREGRDTFFIVEFNGIAIFKRDSADKVNAVHIEAGGYVLEGKKQEKESGGVAAYFFQKKDSGFFRKEKALE